VRVQATRDGCLLEPRKPKGRRQGHQESNHDPTSVDDGMPTAPGPQLAELAFGSDVVCTWKSNAYIFFHIAACDQNILYMCLEPVHVGRPSSQLPIALEIKPHQSSNDMATNVTIGNFICAVRT
jgi:hypothetical protein